MFDDDVIGDSKKQKWIQDMADMHARECNFYSTFGKLGVIPLAECYYTQELCADTRASGIIILEDLTQRAYMDRLEEGLSKQKVENIVKYIAAFHKFVICTEDRKELVKNFKELPFDYKDNKKEGEELIER